MNDKNIDSQLESILLLELEHLKWQMTKLQHVLIINQTLSHVAVDGNMVIVIIIFIVLVVNLPLHHWPIGKPHPP